MIDDRGRMIFQSVCHPQFLSHLQETGLMSCLVQTAFCHCACVCAYKWCTIPASLICDVGMEGVWIIIIFFFSVWFVQLKLVTVYVGVCACVSAFKCVVLKLSREICHHLLPGNTRWHYTSDDINARCSSRLSGSCSPNPQYVRYMQVFTYCFFFSFFTFKCVFFYMFQSEWCRG